MRDILLGLFLGLSVMFAALYYLEREENKALQDAYDTIADKYSVDMLAGEKALRAAERGRKR